MKKKQILATLLVAASLFSSLGNIEIIKPKAATNLSYTTFTMEEGAAVRLKNLTDADGKVVESNGMRFSAEISPDEYTALKDAGARFGMIIVAKDLLPKDKETEKRMEINEETAFGKDSKFYFTNQTGGNPSKIAALNINYAACENIDEDANVEVCGSIANLQVNNFTRSFIGRAYVAIPSVNEETGETDYTYHFAPYYGNEVENNTRCIFYIAQRAREDKKAQAATLQEKYVVPFKDIDRFKNNVYRYFVEHYYIVHNKETDKHTIAHVERVPHYAELDSTVTAHPIIKPTGVPAIEKINFVYDTAFGLDEGKDEIINGVVHKEKDTGLVYAAGMQTLRLYYEAASTANKEHERRTLDELLAWFLNPANAEHNFGLHLNINGMEDWKAVKVFDPEDTSDDPKQIGIGLTADKNASKNRHMLLTKIFFDELRAYGVESMTFRFHCTNNKTIKYNMYQEETYAGDKVPVKVYVQNNKGEWILDPPGSTAEDYGDYEHKAEEIRLYLKDITPGGGVLIELDQSASSNKGEYHFGHVKFEFPTTNNSL
jgi:hypothetical protein